MWGKRKKAEEPEVKTVNKYVQAQERIAIAAKLKREYVAREQQIKKELNTHHDSCPACDGNTFVSEHVRDSSDFSWRYCGYSGGEYRGNLHLGDYHQYGLHYGVLNHVMLKVQTCICGHEWVELPKDSEVK